MESLFNLLFCVVLPLALLVGLLAYFGRRSSSGGPRTVNPYLPAPPRAEVAGPEATSLAAFSSFDRLVARWAEEGRLDPAAAAQVRELLAEHVAATLAPATAPAATPAPGPMDAAGLPAPSLQSAPAIALAGGPADSPAWTPAAQPRPQVAPQPATPPAPKGPSQLERLRAALLALDTRRVLLFLGTFLLLMSSLTLVVFNWNSLPPLVQFAILAGTAAAIWAGGSWMARKPDLASAGRNLQIVASLLMPVVGFALGRPGLLNLSPRPAWLMTSLLSLAAYLIAARQTGRAFYSAAAAVASVSALLAGLGAVAVGWQPAPVILLLAAMLPLTRALKSGSRPALATGPRYVALIGAPTAALLASAFAVPGLASLYALAATAGAAALFCGLAYWVEGRRPWLWAALALPPLAVELLLQGAGADGALRALVRSVAALSYLWLSELAAMRHRPAATPLFVIAIALGALALPLAIQTPRSAALGLPALVLLGGATFALVEGGRMNWLVRWRTATATAGLASAGLLLFAWLDALLELGGLGMGLRGLTLLPLAAIFFAAARWWPGRLQPGYDIALQALGSVVVVFAGSLALIMPDTRLPGALLLTLILGGQAVLRRGWPWAALSLGCGLAAVGLAVDEFAPIRALPRIAPLTALVMSAAYSLAGALLRHSPLAYWTWPAVGWGAAAGAVALAMAVAQVGTWSGVAASVFLGLAVLLALHTWLWREPALGYGAAPLLAIAVGVAGWNGFFTGWTPADGDLAYIICALVIGLAGVGAIGRRFGRAYARPYEQLAFVLLPAAPLAAAGRAEHLTITWAIMAACYAVGLWRYQMPWMLAAAFVAGDLALLHGVGWLAPGGDPAEAGLMIAAAVWLQALGSAWLRRRAGLWPQAASWGYGGALIGGAGALLLTAPSGAYSAAVALLLAALLAVLVWIERREALAWASLALLALGLGQLSRFLGLDIEWALLLGSLEALIVYCLGWGVERLAGRLPPLAPWRRPFGDGGATAGVALPALLAAYAAYLAWPLLGAGLLMLGLAIGVVGWRRRMGWMLAPALAAWSLALAVEGPALGGEIWAAQGALLQLLLAWAIGLAAIWAGRRQGAGLAHPVYGAAVIAGALALQQAWGDAGQAAIVAGALALLCGAAASVEQAEPPAWGTLGLLALALGCAHSAADLSLAWSAAWGVLELLGVSVAGWGATALGLTIWRRPTTQGALGLAAALALAAGTTGALPAIAFALANLGLLLVTLAVRERQLLYAYGAGAAFVGAALCQLANWGVREPQWYVVPAGLYLLALAAGLRRFQGRRRASQLVETAAAMLLLGVTFGQALRPEGGLPYSLLLLGESLALAAYGALARLRVPFLGGVGFFVAGVTWMTVDSVRLANQWVLLGAIGLLMVAAYVVLERHQERLARAGRAWAAQLKSWG